MVEVVEVRGGCSADVPTSPILHNLPVLPGRVDLGTVRYLA